jgi:Ras-related protein Rab-5C
MDLEEEDNMPSFKIVLMGTSGVGKTSIINRYIKQSFDNDVLSTTGICFNSKILNFSETKDSCKIDVII